jgi:hypothetical protein
MDWGVLDDNRFNGGAGMADDNGEDVEYVGVINGEDVGDFLAPKDPPDPSRDPSVRRVSPGQYLKVSNDMQAQAAGQHNGRPMYRVAPGSYVVTDRPMYPQRGRPAQAAMGDWDWGALWETVGEMGPQMLQTGLQYASSEAEREARAEQQRREAELRREEIATEAAQAQREFEARLEREEAAATEAAERRRREHEERMEELRAEAEAAGRVALAPAGMPGWMIALIAVGGLGVVGLLVALLLKKDEKK